MKLSIISPVYGAENIIEKLVEEIEASVSTITDDYEIILPEDGSPDNSWDKIVEISKKNPKVKGIRLSRNFGQHPTIIAGLTYATGDWIVVMDCDLQDNPLEIPKMYNKVIKDNKDVILAKRKERTDNFFKKMSSKLFYKVFSYMTDTKQDSSIANFGIYKKEVIDAVLSMEDYKKMFPVMVKWIGFDVGELEVAHGDRYEGKTTYVFSTLIKLALDTILSFSDKPLILIIRLGLIISSLSFGIGGYTLVEYFLGDIEEPGFTSLMVSIWLLSGMMITLIGIVGLYISRIFEQTKSRPIFIIKEKLNF